MTKQLSLHFIPQGASQVVLVIQHLPASPGDTRDAGLIPGPGRSPGEGSGLPAPVFLPRKFPGQRSLMGYSPWGCKESDTTEHITRPHTIGGWH